MYTDTVHIPFRKAFQKLPASLSVFDAFDGRLKVTNAGWVEAKGACAGI
jgi:hypothetical protein